MNHLQQQTLEDAELILTSKEHNYWGPDLVLKGCRIMLQTSARALTMRNVKFLDCQFEAKKKLVNFKMWCATELQGCSFVGRFEGNDFGHWPEQHPDGSVKDCDFSGAVLDGCRFIDCDIESIKLPAWPCFTILYPHQRQAELESTAWPGELEHWFGGLSWSPEKTAAVVGYAPELVKKYGSNEDELRNILIQLNGILIQRVEKGDGNRLWSLFSLKGSAMAFELSVCCGQTVPDNLRELWPALLIPHGIDCEIYPDFSPEVWSGGFLPFKVISMPAELIDAALLSPAISGFEVDIEGQHIFFRSAMGRTATEFALLCLCAAELAIHTDGEYHDPQAGETYHGDAVRDAALSEIKDALEYEGIVSRTQYPFEGWDQMTVPFVPGSFNATDE